MTKQELISLKDGTPIYIHINGFGAKLTTFDKKRLIVSQGQQGYLDGGMFARPRYIRLATKQDIEDSYQERLKTVNRWKERMLNNIKEVE